MTHTVQVVPSAAKAIGKLDPAIRRRILDALRALEHEPRPAGHKKLKARLSVTYRVRVGDWRILYSIDDQKKVVEVIEVDHRGNVYR